MSNLRKEAFRRMQELKRQKVGSTTITVPKVSKRGRVVRQDEIHADMVNKFWEDVDNKMIDLSRWNGEGNPWLYRELVD